MTETKTNHINDWLLRIIEGPTGMNAMQECEMVIWNEPERVAAARWAIKCLANPRCEGSAEVLEAIMQRRKEVEARR